MAKNIFTLLNDRVLDVDHGTFGTESFALPAWFPNDRVFESEEELLGWCDQQKITHAVLQAGFQKLVIDARAKARPSDVKGVKQPWDRAAMDRVNEFKPEGVKRPGQTGGKATNKAVQDAKDELRRNMIKALQAQGMDENTIKAIVSAL